MRLERRQALWLPILALHGLLLLAHLPRQDATRAPAGGSLSVRLLPTQGEPRPAATPAHGEPTKPPARPALPAPSVAPHAAPAEVPTTVRIAAPDSQPAEAPAPQAPAMTPTPAPGSLLQTEATRQAIRLSARAPLLSERAASASEAPDRENAQQRFGREVGRTAYGNCLKGEFPGAGAGLLSLPMFLIAEASGRCQK